MCANMSVSSPERQGTEIHVPAKTQLLLTKVWHPSRREETILEVYETDGWRGANRDKLKPTAEIQRARIQVELRLVMWVITAYSIVGHLSSSLV